MVVHQTAERGLGFGLEEEPKLRVLKPILRDALALYVHRTHARTPKPMHEFGVDKKAGEWRGRRCHGASSCTVTA